MPATSRFLFVGRPRIIPVNDVSYSQVGAVMALEGHRCIVPVTCLVMVCSPRTLLAEINASAFAAKHALEALTNVALLLPVAKRRFDEHRGALPPDARKHTDTAGVFGFGTRI